MRGRRPLGSIPNRMNEEKWFQKIDWLKYPKSGEMKEIRLYGGAFTIVQHWIQFQNEANEIKRFAVLCPGFNFEEAAFHEDRLDRCILCKHFNDKSLPKYLQFRPKFDYLHDAFDVTAIKDGSRSDVFGAIQINSYGLQDLQDIINSLRQRRDKDLEQIDDNERGYSVMWKYNPNAKDAKTKQGFSEGDHLPIRYHEERGQFYLPKSPGHQSVWGDLHDYFELLSVPEPEAIEEDIRRLKLDEKYAEVTGIRLFGRGGGTSSGGGGGSNWGDEDDAAESEKEEDAPSQTRSSQKTAANDDWEEKDEAPPPRRTSRASEEDADEAPRRRSRSSAADVDEAPQRTSRSQEAASQAAQDDDWEGEDAPKAPSQGKAKATADDWDEPPKQAASQADDDWNDDPPPKRSRATNGKRNGSKAKEEEEAPPDNKRRLSSQEEDGDDWEPPASSRRSQADDAPPSRPSRRGKERRPTTTDDWD